MVMRFLSNVGLNEQDLKLGLGKEVYPSLEFPNYLVTQLPDEIRLNCFSFSLIEYKGIYYNKKSFLSFRKQA